MLVEIVSPKKIEFSEEIDFFIVPGSEGDMGIFDKHTPIISSLDIGLIYLYNKKKIMRKFIVTQGIIEISNNKCVILTEEVNDLDQVDLNSLKKNSSKLKDDPTRNLDYIKESKKIFAIENQYYSSTI